MTRKLDGASRAGTGDDGLLHAPAAARNQAAILDALASHLPQSGAVLELASGTGQHIAALATAHPDLTFYPTDLAEDRLIAIDARCHALANVAPARRLDACEPGWGTNARLDTVLLVNLLHLISEAEMAVLLDEVAKATAPGGLFALYGPFFRADQEPSDGDLQFDQSLRAQDPSIGYKELEVIESVLGVLGFHLSRVDMPANNTLLLARKTTAPSL